MRKMIEELHHVMGLDFEQRKITFEKCKAILSEEIALNPSNIEASCLKAMVVCELREEVEISLAILEECYEKNKNSFSDNDFSLWATNIAYFIFEEYGGEDEELKAVKALEEAVNRKSKYPNTYYALGKYHFGKKNYKQAAEMFRIANDRSPDSKYKYCEAVSLLAAKETTAGVSILKDIYTVPFEDEACDAKICLTLGREMALNGELVKAKELADILLNTKFVDFDIEIDEMADFMYILGDYYKCIELYDKYNFYEEASWLNKYFFALKQIGREDIVKEKLKQIEKRIRQGILEEEQDSSGWESEEACKDYINREKQRLEEIKHCYDFVFTTGKRPPNDIFYNILYMCYYINCPRHYKK